MPGIGLWVEQQNVALSKNELDFPASGSDIVPYCMSINLIHSRRHVGGVSRHRVLIAGSMGWTGFRLFE